MKLYKITNQRGSTILKDFETLDEAKDWIVSHLDMSDEPFTVDEVAS
jgi:hypothetical protein